MASYCSAANIFQGTWSYEPLQNSTFGDVVGKRALFQAICPQTVPHIPFRELRDDNCGHYRPAHFLRTDDCKVRSLSESFAEFLQLYRDEITSVCPISPETGLRNLQSKSDSKSSSKRRGEGCEMTSSTTITSQPLITFVGDSMSYQLYATTVCLAEYYQQTTTFLPLVNHLRHQFLRNDLPCSEECVRNTTYRVVQQASGKYTCFGCSSTGARKIRWIERFPWLFTISATTKILVFNTGAWFTGTLLSDEADTWYEDTLLYMQYFCRQLNRQYPHLDMYFYELTPMVPDADHILHASWDRIKYADKTTLLHHYMGALPQVTVLNTTSIFYQRKHDEGHLNHGVTSDGLHWCYPGLFAVPTFVMESILHLHIEKQRQLIRDRMASAVDGSGSTDESNTAKVEKEGSH